MVIYMARSKLEYWLGEGRDNLIRIASIARTDKEVYEAMGINKDTYYKYISANSDFSDTIKNARESQIEDNTARLKQLHEDMWKAAREREEVVTVVYMKPDPDKPKDPKAMIPTHGYQTKKKLPGDPTLQIYLDKTYGNNINSEEIKSKVDMNRSRAELNRAALNPEQAEESDILKAIMEAGR